MISVKIAAFAAFSGADLLLTKALVNTGLACEANPLADFALKHGGWTGIAIYKAVATVVAMVLMTVIWRMRHKTGERVAFAAALMLGAVVAYSSVLLCVF